MGVSDPAVAPHPPVGVGAGRISSTKRSADCRRSGARFSGSAWRLPERHGWRGFPAGTPDAVSKWSRHSAARGSMTTNCAQSGSTLRCVLAVAVGLSLSSVIHLHGSALDGSALEGGAVPGRLQSSDSREKAAPRSGVCEREVEKLVGQKAVRIGRSMRAPKKLRGVPPKHPELPPGTRASGVWLGEILINDSGKIVRVWPLREIRLVPPFPAFNDAITDAIRQWEFEPLLVQGRAMPVCMTVTVNIDWK
jgi:hypothetical protein